MMRSKWLRRAIVIVSALMVVSVALRAAVALQRGDPFMGENYWGAPVGVYLVLPILAAIIPIGIWWAIKYWR
jgi:hypothetical protein